MRLARQICVAAALAGIPLGGLAAAQSALSTDPTVRNGFYVLGFADEIRKNCPQIGPRLVRAYSYLKGLEQYARNAGYSQSQIDALLDDKSSKEALLRQIRSDLAARGAQPGDQAGHCKVGREEMARGTEAGRLLKAN